MELELELLDKKIISYYDDVAPKTLPHSANIFFQSRKIC